MKLKTILLINAISSGITGMLLAEMPALFANIFHVENTAPFVEVGIFLIVFSLFVLVTALRNPIRERWTKIIIKMDLTWIIASIIAVAALMSAISLAGAAIILAIAAWVGLMAYLQNKALQNS